MSPQAMFENIIDPIDRETLKRELTQDIFIRPTNNASNEIYIFKGDEKPNLMKEVGRLREVSFPRGRRWYRQAIGCGRV